MLITLYQETLVNGISAVAYGGNGSCDFQSAGKDLLNGECNLVLHNRSNEDVSFELVFLASYFIDDGIQMESLMNLAGPYKLTIEANRKHSIHLKEILDVSDVSNHIEAGTAFDLHFKLIGEDGERTRLF